MSINIKETNIEKIEDIGYRIYYKNGLIYEGETSGITPHGYGILKKHDTIIYKGYWINGEKMINKKNNDYDYDYLKYQYYCDPAIILRC